MREGLFSVAQVETLEFERLGEYAEGRRYAVDKTMLDDGGWSLARREVQELLHKLYGAGVSLLEYVNGGFILASRLD